MIDSSQIDQEPTRTSLLFNR